MEVLVISWEQSRELWKVRFFLRNTVWFGQGMGWGYERLDRGVLGFSKRGVDRVEEKPLRVLFDGMEWNFEG